MPLTAVDEPATVDAFGVCFTVEERGKLVRCHVFRSAIYIVEQSTPKPSADLLASFQAARPLFERIASDLYDAGHRNPWIDASGPIARMAAPPA